MQLWTLYENKCVFQGSFIKNKEMIFILLQNQMLKSAFIREQIHDETHLFHHLYQPCKNTLKLNRKYSKNFHLQITFIFIFHLRKKNLHK